MSPKKYIEGQCHKEMHVLLFCSRKQMMTASSRLHEFRANVSDGGFYSQKMGLAGSPVQN
jgi:hypothetical protein